LNVDPGYNRHNGWDNIVANMVLKYTVYLNPNILDPVHMI